MQVPTSSKLLAPVLLAVLFLAGCAQTGEVRTGAAALADWKADAPGVRRHIRPSDVPAPDA